ncbi:MAG: hypothetical protein A3G87_06785 [Omnitrophica bacterium RIFCSPLOWO2_12_FULL_50_11]|nr:MAG: hypothetical protein A3G87_06785 [Omnitrophica bacterium RIFCSPLOWO2_12_FULL_50_11]
MARKKRLINRTFLARELTEFIRCNTVSLQSNERFARRVGSILKESGFRVSYQRTKLSGKTFANVIGIKGKGKRPFLICSHLDTVPPGERTQWTKTKGDPWNATTRKGTIYGLGAADDKGPLAAMLHAGAQVRGRSLKRPLMLMGTFGEESGMAGAKLFRHAWRGPKPCCAIVCEPTNLAITYRHKGLGVIEIEIEQAAKSQSPSGAKRFSVLFKGRQGHSSRPHTGDNALEKAMNSLRGEAKQHPDRRLVSIEGGVAANLIPARASLTFVRNRHPERKYAFSVNPFPPCSPQSVGGIRPKTLCGRISPRFVADGGRLGWGGNQTNTPHLLTWDPSSPLVGEEKSLSSYGRSGAQGKLREGSCSGSFGRSSASFRMTEDLSGPVLACYDSVRRIVQELESQSDRTFVPSVMTSNFGIARTEGRVTKLVFDFRLLPGQSIQAIYRRLKRTLSHKLRAFEGVKWHMTVERDNPPLGLRRDHPFVKAGARLLKEEELPSILSVKPSCTEAGMYAEWGVPTFVFGPGRSAGNVHAPNESIRVSEIEKAIRVYERAIQVFCIEGKPCF